MARYFRVDPQSADAIIAKAQAVVLQWPRIAERLGIPEREQRRLASAFRLAA